MVLFISQKISDYIKKKHGIDLNNDKNISTKKFNPHCCLARLWKSDPDYTFNAGGFNDIQCTYPNIEGEKYCQCHLKKFIENNLPFGSIHEAPPEEPIIKDINGESIRYYWIHQSKDLLKEKIFLKEEEEKQKKYNERRGRGRPPVKKTLYKDINWIDLFNNDNLDSLTLISLKEYLNNKNLNIYGKKIELIERIKLHIRNKIN